LAIASGGVDLVDTSVYVFLSARHHDVDQSCELVGGRIDGARFVEPSETSAVGGADE
jgi:hypothetical protein